MEANNHLILMFFFEDEDVFNDPVKYPHVPSSLFAKGADVLRDIISNHFMVCPPRRLFMCLKRAKAILL
jgi:hypothetical protein